MSSKFGDSNIENVYKLDGRVPILRALFFGIQHVLAMFVSNIAPLTIVAAAAVPELTPKQTGMLIQDAMFVAGIATIVQLYPIWKIGSRLPIVMGISFTFVTILCSIAANYGYPAVMGAVLVGGLFEGTLGLLVRKLVKFIKPIVSASVVCGIGLSLFSVGIRSFGGGYTEDFGSAKNLIVGFVTLAVTILFMVLTRGYIRSLAVLVGFGVGYVLSAILGMADFSGILSGGIVSFPHLFMFKPEFHLGAILSVCIVFLVSAAETIGDTSALVSGGLGRDVTDDEISGSIAVDGYMSAISSLFGCPPITSYSQNVGLIAMTKVVNRFTIFIGAMVLVLAGFFPPLGNFLATMPQAVLGGCTIIMFGQILLSGMQMVAKCGFTKRNITIAALSLSLGIGLTTASEADIWNIFPKIVQDIFAGNAVAVIFVTALFLSYVLPEKMDEDE